VNRRSESEIYSENPEAGRSDQLSSFATLFIIPAKLSGAVRSFKLSVDQENAKDQRYLGCGLENGNETDHNVQFRVDRTEISKAESDAVSIREAID
jgi:hypothetical protein